MARIVALLSIGCSTALAGTACEQENALSMVQMHALKQLGQTPPACTCTPADTCNGWGDPHFTKTFHGPFNYHGTGIQKIASDLTGDFQVQAAQCVYHTEYMVFGAFAVKIGSDIISIIDNDIEVNGIPYQSAPEGAFKLNGGLNAGKTSSFVIEAGCSGCGNRMDVTRRACGTSVAGYYLDMALSLSNSSTNHGVCGGQTSFNNPTCGEMLFSKAQLAIITQKCQWGEGAQLCEEAANESKIPDVFGCRSGCDLEENYGVVAGHGDMCRCSEAGPPAEFEKQASRRRRWIGWECPYTCEMTADASVPGTEIPAPYCWQKGTTVACHQRTPQEVCDDTETNYTLAVDLCNRGITARPSDVELISTDCVFDYCISGGDATMVENAAWEAETEEREEGDCDDGSCTIADDPHITVFDGKQISLMEGHIDVDANFFNILKDSIQDGEEGDMWLVKSAGVSIQARYKRDDSLEDKNLFVRSVALGGDFMKGNKLILSPLDDAVTYNGKEILQTEESEFYIEGVVHAKRHTDAHLVEDVALGNAGIDVQLPGGVRLLLNRQQHYVNVRITMKPAKDGQDGLCGNFNGDANDDSLELIEARNPRVASGQTLF